jgi:hypothetical protein
MKKRPLAILAIVICSFCAGVALQDGHTIVGIFDLFLMALNCFIIFI